MPGSIIMTCEFETSSSAISSIRAGKIDSAMDVEE